MRTVKLEPQSINNDDFSGWVELKVPHAKDRALFFKTLKIKVDSNGQVVQNDDMIEMMAGMVDIAESHLLNAEILDKKTGEKYNKEDVFYKPEFQVLISEIGNICMAGFQPSKK